VPQLTELAPTAPRNWVSGSNTNNCLSRVQKEPNAVSLASIDRTERAGSRAGLTIFEKVNDKRWAYSCQRNITRRYHDD
jgi:hypothetical protein